MRSYIDMIKCSMNQKCLDDSILGAISIYNLRTDIINYVVRREEVPKKLIEAFKKTYKKFAKAFFCKKTIECMFANCKKTMPTDTKYLDKMIKKIDKMKKAISKKPRTKIVRNYQKILTVLKNITKDFATRYNKKYL